MCCKWYLKVYNDFGVFKTKFVTLNTTVCVSFNV